VTTPARGAANPDEPHIPEIRTARLLLRGFTESDLAVWNRTLFADPEVTRYLPIDGRLAGEQLEGAFRRGLAHLASHGYGIWAVSDGSTGAFMGHCGLRHVDDVEETEIFYALAQPFWGRGFTTEPAGAVLEFGLGSGGLARIVAYAVPENRASTNVMTKLGMRYEAETEIFGLRCARYAIERPRRVR